MPHTIKLDGLDLHDGVNYSSERPTFQQPPQRAQVNEFFQGDGGSLVTGTANYGVVTHTVPVWCLPGTAGTVDSLMSNIRALQQRVLMRDTVLEFKFDGATNTNYADVLYAYCDDPYSSEKWDYWIAKGKRVPVNVHLVCKPFWRGPLITSSQTAATLSPVEVLVGETRIEEDDPAITYSGGPWTTTLDTNCSGGSRKVESVTGAYALFTFTGTQVSIIGHTANSRGIAKVFIDGVPITDGDYSLPDDTGSNKSGLNFYSGSNGYKVNLYTKRGLTAGTHTIKIQVSGVKYGVSSGYSIGLDAFDVVGLLGNVPTPLRVWATPTEGDGFVRCYFGTCMTDTRTSLIFDDPDMGGSGIEYADTNRHGGWVSRRSISSTGPGSIAGEDGYLNIAVMDDVDLTRFKGRFRLLAAMKTADPIPTAVKLAYVPTFGNCQPRYAPIVGTKKIQPFTDNNWTLVDFGVVDLPPGPITESYTPNYDKIIIHAKGSGATGYDFDTDFLVFLPLDSTFFLEGKVYANELADMSFLIDGLSDEMHISEVADGTLSAAYKEAVRWPGGEDISACGGPLMVDPASTNRLVAFSYPGDSESAAHSVFESLHTLKLMYAYYPRYLSPVR